MFRLKYMPRKGGPITMLMLIFELLNVPSSFRFKMDSATAKVAFFIKFENDPRNKFQNRRAYDAHPSGWCLILSHALHHRHAHKWENPNYIPIDKKLKNYFVGNSGSTFFWMRENSVIKFKFFDARRSDSSHIKCRLELAFDSTVQHLSHESETKKRRRWCDWNGVRRKLCH